jgi:hypothetical protein
MRTAPFATALACGVLLGLAGVNAYGGESDPPSCPVTAVIPDAGAADLPPLGEYVTGKTCEPFCGPRLPVCRRIKELVLTCQPGCG